MGADPVRRRHAGARLGASPTINVKPPVRTLDLGVFGPHRFSGYPEPWGLNLGPWHAGVDGLGGITQLLAAGAAVKYNMCVAPSATGLLHCHYLSKRLRSVEMWGRMTRQTSDLCSSHDTQCRHGGRMGIERCHVKKRQHILGGGGGGGVRLVLDPNTRGVVVVGRGGKRGGGHQ